MMGNQQEFIDVGLRRQKVMKSGHFTSSTSSCENIEYRKIVERETSSPTGSESNNEDDKKNDDYGNARIPDYCQSIQITDGHGHVRQLLFPRGLDLDRPKRSRTTFTVEQLKELEDEFQRNQYLAGRNRSELSSKLGLSETQIKVWFQNRRTKHKREKSRDLEQQKSMAESTATCNVLRLLQERRTTNTDTPLRMPFPPTNTAMAYLSLVTSSSHIGTNPWTN